MLKEQLIKKGEDIVEEMEQLPEDADPMTLGKLKESLAAVMAQIDAMTAAEEAKAKLQESKVEESKSVPAAPAPLPVVSDETSECKAEVIAFHKAWHGKPLMGDTEAGLVYKSHGKRTHGLSAPTILKSILFGRRVSQQMGWAKKLNPTDDSSLIPNDYDPELSYIPGEASNIMDLCRIVPAPRGNLQITRLDRTNSPSEWGVTASWLVSGSTKPETEPVWERLSINCGELAAYTAVADRLITRSAFDLMAELARMFTGQLKHLIDVAIMQGTGTNQPTGIIGYAGTNSETRETASEVGYIDLVNLKNGVNPRAIAGGTFVIQHDAFNVIERTLSTVDGRPLFAATTASGPYDRMLGYPFIVTVDCNAALGADGDAVYGNFRYYTVALEDDVVFATDEGKGSGFTANTTYVKAYCSVGGLPIEPDAFSILDADVT